jgi:hypothetical protein
MKFKTYRNLTSKIRENVKFIFGETRIMSFINLFRDSLWPGGQLKAANASRTPEEKARTRDEANRKLSALVPGTCLGEKLYCNRITQLCFLPRSGCQHDWTFKCTARCKKDFCGPAEPPFESTYCIYSTRRSQSSVFSK